MSQDLNNNNLDKNLKFMVISAIVLIVLFFYIMFKSSAHLSGGSYYMGLFFLFMLFGLAIILRVKKNKIQKFLSKYTNRPSPFEEELSKNRTTNVPLEDLNSSIQAQTSDISFKDVAGIKSIKAELEEVVLFLNKPEKFLKHGVKLPKGVLLVGPPGVGKTLMARAVAGEANVPFFYQSGSSFVHIYVGMGAKKVRELFAVAKANAPAVIFIDEIDAVGKKRVGGSNDEREATLNELLTQMDGFEGDSGIIVIAATNKIEILDEALLRAGRFDRRVYLSLPNIEDRKQILELYLKDKKYDFDMDLLAASTSGFSSASISTLINESLLNMIKREDVCITLPDIELAKNKLEFGKKEIKILDETQKDILAIYQASKAYISKKEVSLFNDGISKKSRVFPSKSELYEDLKEYLAGSIGVDVVKNEQYAVNIDDLKDADILALKIVNEYKMANSKDDLINEIKNSLRSELSLNIEEIIRLKELMIKNEVITLNDF